MKYKRKPLIVQAIKFDPHTTPWPQGVRPWPDEHGATPRDMSWGYIDTESGRQHVIAGDYIVTNERGETFRSQGKYFEETYEPLELAPQEHPPAHELINDIIKELKTSDIIKTSQISDGYHTFEELYTHRMHLFVALCNVIEQRQTMTDFDNDLRPWKSKRHSDGVEVKFVFDGDWFIAGIGYHVGKQITYHLPTEYYWDALKIKELQNAPQWDGHTPNDVIERLKNF